MLQTRVSNENCWISRCLEAGWVAHTQPPPVNQGGGDGGGGEGDGDGADGDCDGVKGW